MNTKVPGNLVGEHCTSSFKTNCLNFLVAVTCKINTKQEQPKHITRRNKSTVGQNTKKAKNKKDKKTNNRPVCCEDQNFC